MKRNSMVRGELDRDRGRTFGKIRDGMLVAIPMAAEGRFSLWIHPLRTHSPANEASAMLVRQVSRSHRQ